MTVEDREEQLRQRAYGIWQAEGEPHGRDREHWEMAERDLAPAPSEASDTPEVVTEDAPKPAQKPAPSRRKKAEATAISEPSSEAEPTAKPKARKPRATKTG
ncbi:DUF2934 domain-containing protein [Sphingomonas sp. SORGH_AS_0879]|uniref:DUF2934 domain-containing protein n=1 Tax=Sphingomonas sp. SORGH_AS_0879 TaxID=3041790 RepID=UPI002786D0E4|nr:DUF2934 domain-containing protein [Sphingomonas sp. SORGH_AS_0879]MDQ1230897.1 hypothetical protein [Sphingomonas sp. SORGH_AS_0879]